MEELKKQAYDLFVAFDKTFNNGWGALEVACEYCIQLGHLGVVLSQDKLIDLDTTDIKESGRNLNSVPDELSDCMLQLLTLYYLLDIKPILQKPVATGITQHYGQLIVMGGQIVDSVMIAQKKKFSLDRDEKEFVSSRINKSLNIVVSLFSHLGYNHRKEFIKMADGVQSFLDKRNNQNGR